MKKWICAVLCAAALALASSGAAQEIKSYVYGGSSRDWLYHMAVSDNGYIALTGWTESSDGTLQNRTKSGRSGWLLVIDREGKEIVNFCTRRMLHDHLEAPVFLADGTLCVILFAEDPGSGEQILEIIHLDMAGKDIFRKTIMRADADDNQYISVVGHTARGYVLHKRVHGDGIDESGYFLYGFDGESLGELKGWSVPDVVADAHVLRTGDEEENAVFLYRIDDDGGEIKLSKAFDLREDRKRPALYHGLVSLPDGGAAGVGWMLDDKAAEGEERPGVFTRWDAQGRVVSEMRTPGVHYTSLALHPGGFAAVGCPEEQAFSYRSCALYLLDAQGVIRRRIDLGEAECIGPEVQVAALGDGTAVTVKVVSDNQGDAVVTVIAP